MSPSHTLPTQCSERRKRRHHPLQDGACTSRHNAISQLHSSIGNRALASLLHAGVIQAKSLRIGAPDDQYEREADHVADQIMRMPDSDQGAPGFSVQPAARGHAQRKCAKCDEEEILHRQTLDNENEEIRTQSDPTLFGTRNVDEDTEAAISDLRAGGHPLSPATRSIFEPRFGQDFSQVRVHTSPGAAAAAKAVNARAFTIGRDVVFGQGQYAPDNENGKRLLAHELTHVMQQSTHARESSQTALAPGPLRQRASGPSAFTAASPAARVTASRPLIQRQENASVHSSPQTPSVPSEKWRSDVESAYRRSGFIEAADAVQACRESGKCGRLLTQKEAWDAYRTGRIGAKLGEPPEKSLGEGSASSVAVAGLAAPAAVSSGALSSSQATAADTALERAALRWGTAAVRSGVAAAATTAEVGAATTAATGTAAAATIAVPIAAGVVLAIAVIDLVSYGNFQIALRKLGYVVLPEPLGVCIGLCHQPSAPTFRQRAPFPREESLDPQLIEDWLKRTSPGPATTPVVGAQESTRDDAQSRGRRGRWTCEAQCNVQQIKPGAVCPDRVYGIGTGPNQEEACREAKRAATQSTPQGCYPRHCRCLNCVNT